MPLVDWSVIQSIYGAKGPRKLSPEAQGRHIFVAGPPSDPEAAPPLAPTPPSPAPTPTSPSPTSGLLAIRNTDKPPVTPPVAVGSGLLSPKSAQSGAARQEPRVPLLQFGGAARQEPRVPLLQFGGAAPVQQAAAPPAPSPAPGPAASRPPPISFEDRLDAILSGDSALMRQAATQGRQYAQSRGLLNTSLGAQAAQTALLSQAVRIAQAEADTALGQQQLDLQRQAMEEGLKFDRERLAQEFNIEGRRLNLQTRSIELDEAFRQKQLQWEIAKEKQRLSFDRMRFKADVSYRNRQLAQIAKLERQKMALQSEALGMDEEFRQKELQWRVDAETQRLSFDRNRFLSDEDYRNGELDRRTDLENRKIDIELDKVGIETRRLDHQVGIETRQLDQQSKRDAYTLVAANWGDNSMLLSSVYNNPEMPNKESAIAYVNSLTKRRMNFIRSLTGLDLSP